MPNISMGQTNEGVTMHDCSETIASVNGILEYFFDFVVMCLDNADYKKEIKTLLPFDIIMQSKLKNVFDESLVKSLGLSMMRMDLDPPTYSLGVSIEIAEGTYNHAIDVTIFISAGKTLEEIEEYVRTDDFATQVRDLFERRVEICFGQTKTNE